MLTLRMCCYQKIIFIKIILGVVAVTQYHRTFHHSKIFSYLSSVAVLWAQLSAQVCFTLGWLRCWHRFEVEAFILGIYFHFFIYWDLAWSQGDLKSFTTSLLLLQFAHILTIWSRIEAPCRGCRFIRLFCRAESLISNETSSKKHFLWFEIKMITGYLLMRSIPQLFSQHRCPVAEFLHHHL